MLRVASPPQKLASCWLVEELLQVGAWRIGAIAAVVAEIAGQEAENVVAEARIPERTFKAEAVIVIAQRRFDRIGALDTEIGIADLECAGPVVGAAREQFDLSWRPRRTAEGQPEFQSIAHIEQEPQPSR